jgi:hypothetical protein
LIAEFATEETANSMCPVCSVFSASEVRSANDPYFEQLCQVEKVIVAIVNVGSNDLVVEVESLPDPFISWRKIEKEGVEAKFNE